MRLRVRFRDRDLFRNLGIGLVVCGRIRLSAHGPQLPEFRRPLRWLILALPATLCGIEPFISRRRSAFLADGCDHGGWCRIRGRIPNSGWSHWRVNSSLEGNTVFRGCCLEAGRTRAPPVSMTAAAMIVGMLPMAIGGPGEEDAALARAVIGLPSDSHHLAHRPVSCCVHVAQAQRRDSLWRVRLPNE